MYLLYTRIIEEVISMRRWFVSLLVISALLLPGSALQAKTTEPAKASSTAEHKKAHKHKKFFHRKHHKKAGEAETGTSTAPK